MKACFSAAIIFLVFSELLWSSTATLIASSEINICGRDRLDFEPKQLDSKVCKKKFVVALTVENGKVSYIIISS